MKAQSPIEFPAPANEHGSNVRYGLHGGVPYIPVASLSSRHRGANETPLKAQRSRTNYAAYAGHRCRSAVACERIA